MKKGIAVLAVQDVACGSHYRGRCLSRTRRFRYRDWHQWPNTSAAADFISFGKEKGAGEVSADIISRWFVLGADTGVPKPGNDEAGTAKQRLGGATPA